MSRLLCVPMKKVQILQNMSYVRKCMTIHKMRHLLTKIECLQLVNVRRLIINKNYDDTKTSRIYIKYIQFGMVIVQTRTLVNLQSLSLDCIITPRHTIYILLLLLLLYTIVSSFVPSLITQSFFELETWNFRQKIFKKICKKNLQKKKNSKATPTFF